MGSDEEHRSLSYRVNDKTVLFGIVCDPRDPGYNALIHNMCFQDNRLNCLYVPFRVSEDELEDFLEACPKIGTHGLTVASPHRETIMDNLTMIEASSHEIGAVTSVQFKADERRSIRRRKSHLLELASRARDANDHQCYTFRRTSEFEPMSV